MTSPDEYDEKQERIDECCREVVEACHDLGRHTLRPPYRWWQGWRMPWLTILAITIALAFIAVAAHGSQADVCPGGPPDDYCDPWTMATYMTGPDPEVTLPVWNPCDLDCDRAIDLWDVAAWQRMEWRGWDAE